jgi:hypothetical protein
MPPMRYVGNDSCAAAREHFSDHLIWIGTAGKIEVKRIVFSRRYTHHDALGSANGELVLMRMIFLLI